MIAPGGTKWTADFGWAREHVLDAAWLVRRAARGLGLPGALSVVLLAGAAWIHFVETPKSRVALADLEADLARLHRAQSTPARIEAHESPLEILRSQLEPQARFAAVVEDLNASLATANVTLVEATIGTPTFKELQTIGRIDMTVYARGPYAAVKSAVGALLQRHPGLGLEQLTLEKNDDAAAVLDAHLRFAYFFRK